MTEVIDKITKCNARFCIVPVLRRGFDLPFQRVCFMRWMGLPKSGSNCALACVSVFFHAFCFLVLVLVWGLDCATAAAGGIFAASGIVPVVCAGACNDSVGSALMAWFVG